MQRNGKKTQYPDKLFPENKQLLTIIQLIKIYDD